jgi:hypothetical protein
MCSTDTARVTSNLTESCAQGHLGSTALLSIHLYQQADTRDNDCIPSSSECRNMGTTLEHDLRVIHLAPQQKHHNDQSILGNRMDPSKVYYRRVKD